MTNRPAVDPAPLAHPLIVFDDECVFCHRSAGLILRLDPGGVFKFTGRNSATAQRLVTPLLGGEPRPNSMLLVEDGLLYSRSDVPLRIARRLGLPWSLAYGFTIVPRPMRDLVYDVIARNRHRLSRGEICPVPTPALRARLID